MATNFKTPHKLNPSTTPSKPSKTGTISKVRVIVRVRPFLPHDLASDNGHSLSCVSAQFDSPHEVSVHLNDQETSRHECYKLDGYFGEEDNCVSKVFEKEVRPLIPGVFHGCNATVFAYGATGSGKTYTMQGTDEQPGLMPLAMSTVLSMCQTTGSIAEISYYEVYLDRCYDLLEVKAKEISVLDDKQGQVHLRGLSRISVNSMAEFYEVFTCGIQRRKVAHTGLNDVSSRSHGVLVITVSKPSDNGPSSFTGKLNLIDLAGNEDNKRSGNEGIRMQESAKINQSLFALSNVIYALNNNKSWVPYRESKLTRILQDSLGGTSRALMVACLSPGDYQESVHTVSLSARSRHISNVVPSAQKQETPKVKIDMEAKLQAWLESKGKAKSAQRMGAFGSPFILRTPGSVSSMKKQAAHHSSVKPNAANQGACAVKDRFMSLPQRKLFNGEAPPDSGKDNVCLQGLEDPKDILSGTNINDLMLLEVGDLSSNSAAPNFADSHYCLSEMQESVAKDTTTKECLFRDIINYSGKDNVCLQGLEDPKDILSGTNINDLMLLEVGDLSSNSAAPNFADSHYCLSEMQESVAKDTTTKECITDGTGIKSFTFLPSELLDELLKEDEKTESNADNVCQYSPPNRSKSKPCRSPLREALSPINTNITRVPMEEISSRDNVLSVLLESKTPTTPFVVTREKFIDFNTPLDKFNARSSNLKSFLVEEYIDFLNTATRDELVELKGIGAKRAEYIIELRETSPLKSLSDLEKIGLSFKQVQQMFSKAARGIFE